MDQMLKTKLLGTGTNTAALDHFAFLIYMKGKSHSPQEVGPG